MIIIPADRGRLAPTLQRHCQCLTVGTITGLLAAGETVESVLELYPSLEQEDIYAAAAYASWRTEEQHLPLKAS